MIKVERDDHGTAIHADLSDLFVDGLVKIKVEAYVDDQEVAKIGEIVQGLIALGHVGKRG